MKWLQLNCRDSVATTCRSGKTSARRIMRDRLGTENPFPNSEANSFDSVERISFP
jgi:hypothetical protein